ncbi:MAG: hypothetical protein WB239_14385 [Acidimicrobiia bacterium]
MNSQVIVPQRAPADLNHLRIGATYEVVTPHGSTIGQYLGVETTHDVWSVLLRRTSGIDSIWFSRIEAMTLLTD